MNSLISNKIKTLAKKRGLIILICILLTLLCLTLINKMENKYNNKTQIEVLRVKRNIEADTELSQDMFEIVRIEAIKGLEYATVEDLENKMVNTKLYQGEDLIKNKLQDEDSSDNSEKILYSLKVSPDAALVGTIRSGDKILIGGTLVEGTNAISDYVLKERDGQPKDVRVYKVYSEDNTEIKDGNTVAWQFILELEEIEDVLTLDKAINTQKINLVMSSK